MNITMTPEQLGRELLGLNKPALSARVRERKVERAVDGLMFDLDLPEAARDDATTLVDLLVAQYEAES